MPIILSRKKSIVLGLGLLGTFFVVSGIAIHFHNAARIPPSSSQEQKEAEGAAPASPPTPGGSSIGFVMNEFHRSSVKDGKLVWEIFGKRGRYDAGNNKAEVDEPRLTVIRDNGDTVTLNAKRAELTLTGAELLKAELFEDVVVVYKGETTIKTQQALYEKSTESVEIPTPVEVESPLFTIKGQKLKGNVSSQEMVMTNGVKSTFKPRKR